MNEKLPRRERLRLAGLFFIDLMHPVLVLSLVIPLLYLAAPDRSEADVKAMYRAGFLLLPLAALIRGSLWKVKKYWQFLLITIATAFAGWQVSARIAQRFLGSPARYIFPVLFAVLVLIYAFDMIRLRRREHERERARRENDTGWVDRPLMFEHPSLLWLIPIAIGYLAALLTDCPALCDACLANGFVYLLIALISGFYRADADFIRSRADISHVPGKRMRRIGEGMMLILVLAAAACIVPALLTREHRPYRDLRKAGTSFFDVSPWESSMEMMRETETGTEWYFEFADEEGFELPFWVDYIFYAVGAVFFLFLLYMVWLGIRERLRQFESAVEENGDLVERLDDPDRSSRIRRRFFGGPLSEREKVRRSYRRMIRKTLKKTPHPAQMPDEIERLAGTDKTPEGQKMHQLYEEKRYGEDEF